MENKIKVVALFGKSASGKDTIQKWLVSQFPVATHGIVSCTTRAKRDYEEEGKDYFFLTNETFAQKVLDGSMLEATEFNGWFYGTPIEGLQPGVINIGVFNPTGIESLKADSRLEVLPIYVTAEDWTRLRRSLNREAKPNCHEICRRFFTDEDDFKDFEFDYCILDNDIHFDEKLAISYLQDFDLYYNTVKKKNQSVLSKKIN